MNTFEYRFLCPIPECTYSHESGIKLSTHGKLAHNADFDKEYTQVLCAICKRPYRTIRKCKEHEAKCKLEKPDDVVNESQESSNSATQSTMISESVESLELRVKFMQAEIAQLKGMMENAVQHYEGSINKLEAELKRERVRVWALLNC